jgi:NAD(P)-dependent dehydrogenase (short-subunit alcohol dehydrogenase family)
MPVALITGANRGPGLAFARAYVARGWQVIATVRRPQEAHSLLRLA